ncbi:MULTISPECIES: hypothetical protein [unclassified Campylobacter]|uniref:hypothetical protein n=1 Tax=unclassified Campylobacter TaxID=2593542 RepID=UPI003D344A73
MKVALINKNPAVSRLITLSLNKIGAEYIELEDASLLEEKVDFAIVDSDVDASNETLSAWASKVMHLVPRGSEKVGEICLEKPFLPTEFLTLFEQNKPQEQPSTKTESQNVFVDEDTNLEAEFDSFELPEISDIEPLQEPEELDISSAFDIGEELDIGNELDIAMNLNLSEPEDEKAQDKDMDNTLDEMALSIDDDAKIKGDGDEFNLDDLVLDEAQKDSDKISKTSDDEIKFDDSDLNFEEEQANELSDDANSVLDEIEHMSDEIIEQPSEPTNKEAFDVSNLVDELSDISEDDEIKNIQNALNEIDESEPEILDELENEALDKATDDELSLDEAELKSQIELDDETKTSEKSQINLDDEIDESVLENEIKHQEIPSLVDESELENEDMLDELDINTLALDSDQKTDLTDDKILMEQEKLDAAEDLTEIKETQMYESLDDMQEEKIEQDIFDEALKEEQTANKANKQDDLVNEFKDELNDEILSSNIDTSAMQDIDDISENAMLLAFGMPANEPEILIANEVKETKAQEIAESNEVVSQIKEQISQQISASISASSIREALKGMNIKINISFEENE